MFELHPPSDEGGQKEGCEFLAAPTAENWVTIRRQQKQPGVVARTRLAHLSCLAKTLTLTHLQALDMAVLYLFWWRQVKSDISFWSVRSNAQQYPITLRPKTPLYRVEYFPSSFIIPILVLWCTHYAVHNVTESETLAWILTFPGNSSSCWKPVVTQSPSSLGYSPPLPDGLYCTLGAVQRAGILIARHSTSLFIPLILSPTIIHANTYG